VAKLNYQNTVVDISKGLKSTKGIIKVLILTPDYAFTAPMVTGLTTYPDLQITVLDTIFFETLTVADLLPYDVVFAYNDYTWESSGGDRTVVGDVLKDYLDAGGKVVENLFLKSYDNWGVAGGYVTGNYSAFGITTTDTWAATSLGTVLDPLHPVMTGVSTLSNDFDDQDPTLATGATEIADWADGNIAIAVKPNVVSINMMPVNPNNGSPILGFTGDGLILYHNAIVWLAGAPIAHCDISPIQLIAPLNSDSLTTSDSIKVKVANNDSIDHFNIPITYIIDSGTPYNDTITDTIAGGSFIIFTFLQPYDFSAPGHVFNVEIYTSYSCDTVNTNDTLLTTIYNDFDAASLSIDMNPIIGSGNVNPLATVENAGSLPITFDVTMNIDTYTSTKSVTSLAPGATQQITFDPWTAAVGNYTIEVYTQLANDMDFSNDTITQAISVQNLTKVYCYVAYDPSSTLPAGPAYTYLQAPNTIVSLADQSAQNFVGAGTWGGVNKWYGVVYNDNTLVTLDTVTGVRTVIGPVGAAISGISYDYTTSKLYSVSWDGSASSLYSISTASGAAILIGQSTSDLLINLACDTLGNLYAVGIVSDTLYSVNKNTGAVTPIGDIGFNASYAQDMEFDRATNTLCMAAYDADLSTGKLVTVNTATGATTLIGNFAGGAEITGFAIPYNATLPALDAGVSEKTSPIDACGLGNEDITVVVENFGASAINNVPVSYKINGGTSVIETITTSIPAGGYLNYTFSTQANLSTAGVYTIKAYTALTSDAIAANDTLTFTVENIAPSAPTYSMGFETTENFLGWVIEDVNNDGYKWNIVSTGGNTGPYCAQYSYNSASAADDWLITKCISLQASKTYHVSYWYKVQSATYPESFMVHIGNSSSSASLTTMLADHPNLTNVTYTHGGADFTVSSTGVYYIGFHCNSAADKYILFLDDINITDVTGITENTVNTIINVYPNPAKDVLNIYSSAKIGWIKLLNVYGQLILSNEVNSVNFTVNTSNLADGIYYLQIETKDGLTTRDITICK
ncbi:MAG: choice-of-anchor J domain-containing protein, partial [Bacteroidales bacterium]